MHSVHILDPDEKQDFSVDWAAEMASGEVISTSAWEVHPGLTTSSEANTDTTATIWLEAGRPGRSYYAINRITTDAGRKFDQTLRIRCEST